jgi:hypothetical protein
VTPEGQVKKNLKELLDTYETIYIFNPVPSGYGKSSLDTLLCYRGRFIAVEAKAPGKQPTPRQRFTTREIRAAGGKVFRVDGTDDHPLEPLKAYLDELSKQPDLGSGIPPPQAGGGAGDAAA